MQWQRYTTHPIQWQQQQHTGHNELASLVTSYLQTLMKAAYESNMLWQLILPYVHVNLQGRNHKHVYRCNYYICIYICICIHTIYTYRSTNISILVCTQLNKIVPCIYEPISGCYIQPPTYTYTIVKLKKRVHAGNFLSRNFLRLFYKYACIQKHIWYTWISMSTLFNYRNMYTSKHAYTHIRQVVVSHN